MRRKLLFVVLMLAVFTVTLVSCSRLLPTPETSVEALYTQAAQTIQAQLTQQTFGTPGVSPTQTMSTPGVNPTNSELPTQPATATPTNTPVPSLTPTKLLPTPTAMPPSATPIPILCDHASFIKYVTVPDGTTYTPGAEFIKIWRLRNVGSCTWDEDYSLVYVSGDRMNSSRAVSLKEIVRPGEDVELGVDFLAPASQGRYRSYWMLEDPDGNVFGIGDDAESSFWVDIRVQTPNENFAFDLATNMCTATWRSSDGPLSCPGDPDDDEGSVTMLAQPELENGRRENEPAIWTRPEATRDGWIQGVYPPYKVKEGDHFLADIGCLEGYKSCEVLFTLEYQISGGSVKKLGEWYEVYDDAVTRIDIDLSELEGKNVQLILSITGYGKPSHNNPFWLVPSVRRIAPSPTPVVYAPPIEAARQRVAKDTGTDPKDIIVQSFEMTEWKDSCLGVHLPDQICAEALIPGYRINMVAGDDYYEAHTNADASVIYWFEQ